MSEIDARALDELDALELAEEIWEDEPNDAEQLLMQRVLTSDWFRDHDARVWAEALRDAADALDAEWNRLDVEFRPIRGDQHNEGVLSGLERAENLLRARADREGR